MYFHSDKVQQRLVKKGESFTHSIPIKWVKEGEPTKIEITLYLFGEKIGSAGLNVVKVYTTSQPTRDDDGQSFFDVLPPPNQAKSNVEDQHD